ncbi:hypothetical protein OEZ85_006715 [Tetradesmus obliquus]|uniref:Uncharacterized protein n=1 Tax=Tetradesmus obliquus TaxID=3088 RepID=A0ABY8TVG0_TETOB|nr:hypothetical protein OEZ85_006715 [Tetradesmus obliquus]
MDGLVSISMEQVWASSSASATAYSAANFGYSSHSRSPRPHPVSPLSHLHPSTPSSTAATVNNSSSSSGSSSSSTARRHQPTSNGGSSRGTAALSVAVVQIGSSSSSSSSSSSPAAVRERLFEPLDAAAGRDYRDQAPQAAGQPIPITAARRRSLPAAIPANSPMTRPSSSSGNAGASSSSSSSSSSMRLLQRRHSSGGSFLSSTAGQLLSSLGYLGGLSRLSSSPPGGIRGSSSSSQGQLPVGRVQLRPSTLGASRSALRHVLLVRSPAVLLDQPGSSSSESYDDLLALDQFNVKHKVLITHQLIGRRFIECRAAKTRDTCSLGFMTHQRHSESSRAPVKHARSYSAPALFDLELLLCKLNSGNRCSLTCAHKWVHQNEAQVSSCHPAVSCKHPTTTMQALQQQT